MKNLFLSLCVTISIPMIATSGNTNLVNQKNSKQMEYLDLASPSSTPKKSSPAKFPKFPATQSKPATSDTQKPVSWGKSARDRSLSKSIGYLFQTTEVDQDSSAFDTNSIIKDYINVRLLELTKKPDLGALMSDEPFYTILIGLIKGDINYPALDDKLLGALTTSLINNFESIFIALDWNYLYDVEGRHALKAVAPQNALALDTPQLLSYISVHLDNVKKRFIMLCAMLDIKLIIPAACHNRKSETAKI